MTVVRFLRTALCLMLLGSVVCLTGCAGGTAPNSSAVSGLGTETIPQPESDTPNGSAVSEPKAEKVPPSKSDTPNSSAASEPKAEKVPPSKSDTPNSSAVSEPEDEEVPPPKFGVPDGYELVWGDEFDGNTLDLTKWRIYDGELNSSAGGKVRLSANDETVSVHDGCVTLRYFKTGDGTGWYGSDALKTTETMQYHCGYLEMRARIPDGIGVYSSFWSRGKEKDFFEIDMFESLGQAHRLTANVHKWPSAESGQQHSSLDGVVDPLSRRYFLAGSSFSEGFHTFALLWTEERMTFYCDGEEYYTYELDAYFKDKYQYIVTGFNVGWKDRTPPDASLSYPIEMDIDYIRLYQQPGKTALLLGQ